MNAARFNVGLYLAALVGLLDQASKWWVLKNVFDDTRFQRVTSYLNLKLSWNKGVTFGLFNDFSEWAPYILSAVAVVILLLLINWLRRAETVLSAMGLGLVMGGAIGNVIDRLRYGSVVDFLDFHLMGFHWYTFNVADMAIVTGVAFLLLENFSITRKKR